MYALFKAEFLRYRNWGLIVLVTHLGIWLFMGRLGPLLEIGGEFKSISYLATVLLSVGFGALQMFLRRRQNDWTFLIQRPLAPYKIYLAIAAAAIACIGIALPVGWLILVGGLDLFTETVVDGRHYFHAAYSFTTAISSYLVGSLIMLSASRGAMLLLGTLTLVLTNITTDTGVAFLIAFALIGLLLFMNAKSFKPDLGTHVTGVPAIALMSLPMQFSIVSVLLLAVVLFYHVPRFIIGNHPDNNPVDGTYAYLWTLDEADRLAYVLRDSDLPNKESLIRQAGLADFERLYSGRERFQKRGQLHFLDEQHGITHSETSTHWAFSHTRMLLQGNHTVTGAVVGFVGVNGFLEPGATITSDDQFTTVPFLIANRFLQTRQSLYEIDFTEQIVSTKFALEGNEVFHRRPDFREHFVAVSSNQNVYLFDAEEYRDEHLPALPEHVLPHPESFSDGVNVDLYRLVDGYLIIYHDAEYVAFDQSGAEVVYARLDESTERLHKTVFLQHSHPGTIRHFTYAVSPMLDVLKNAIYRAINPSDSGNRSIRESAAMRMPVDVNVSVAIFALVAVAGVLLLSRRIRLNRAKSVLWTIMAVAFGLPALISFCLMNRLQVTRT